MSSVVRVIEGRPRDLGGFEVRRLLPATGRQTIGPFIFFDHMGPARFAVGHGVDVRPHPHIGLATVTYLFAGSFMHRDSLGTVQLIRPGDVNWMVAGRGIVHSERTPPELRLEPDTLLHGIQTWVALPRANEEDPPSFVHHPAATLPLVTLERATARVIAGTAFGASSPLVVCSDTLYADLQLERGADVLIETPSIERALYVVEGEIESGNGHLEAGQMIEFVPGAEVRLRAQTPARAMLFGGAPTDGSRHIWWNFVSSSRERIERAKADWREQRFAHVPDDPERIPLPES
jgi:redox-sensitive bicupin YhaK (pirin superfamily)